MPQFVQVGIVTIQLNPISVFVMIYSVNTNKDSNVVIEHNVIGNLINKDRQRWTLMLQKWSFVSDSSPIIALSTLVSLTDWMTDSC